MSFGQGFVEVAPSPALAWFVGAHDGMANGAEVTASVSAGRAVAAGDVTAVEALAEVDPAAALLKAVKAALGAVWVDAAGGAFKVCARGHGLSCRRLSIARGGATSPTRGGPRWLPVTR